MPDDTSTNLWAPSWPSRNGARVGRQRHRKTQKGNCRSKTWRGRLDRDSRPFQSCPILPSQYTVPIGEGEAWRHRCPPPRTLSSRTVLGTLFFSLGYLILGEPERFPLEPSVNAQERGLYRLESLTCNTSAKIWPANTPGVLPCRLACLASALTSSIVDCCKVQQIVRPLGTGFLPALGCKPPRGIVVTHPLWPLGVLSADLR